MVEFPKKIPVKPPEMNKLTKPIANNAAGVKRILLRHNVEGVGVGDGVVLRRENA